LQTLEHLKNDHPICSLILECKKLKKILTSYIRKINKNVDNDSRLRTNFNQHVATSGRLSSSGKFAAQTVPRKDKTIKSAIKAGNGYKIVAADYKTAEMYYAAKVSRDAVLTKAFKDGVDVHTMTAISCFDIVVPKEYKNNPKAYIDEHYPDERHIAKTVNFLLLYGGGAATLANSANIPLDRAQAIVKNFGSKYSGLNRWIRETSNFILNNGYIMSPFGRKRRLPEVFSPINEVRQKAIRSGVNSVIQSLASDANLLTCVLVFEELQKMYGHLPFEEWPIKIFLLVHDSIVAEVREDLVGYYIDLLRSKVLEDKFMIPGTPITIDVEIGDSYADCG